MPENAEQIAADQEHDMWVDILDIVFDLAHVNGWSNSELARQANLSTATVGRLSYRQFHWMQTTTIGKLMAAVGITLQAYKEQTGRPIKKRVARVA